MPTVTELYRYPVKSFTPERLDELRVVNGVVKGDRVLGFRFANQGTPDDWSWRRKINFVGLVNTPGIALLELSFDDESRMLSLKYKNEIFKKATIFYKDRNLKYYNILLFTSFSFFICFNFYF